MSNICYKSFGEHEVLKDINVHIQEKEVVCVIGPSGSGKSTFLRCLNLLEPITSGRVVVDGHDLTDPEDGYQPCPDRNGHGVPTF